MRVTVDWSRATAVIDALIERWRKKQFPYNLPSATLPQKEYLDDIRKDPALLARFYFFICIYMRGGVESHTAFRQFILMHRKHPELFDAATVHTLPVEDISLVLKQFLGWDSRTAGKFWHRNAELLHRNWGGDARNIVRGCTSYDEALRRIMNKRGKVTSLDPAEAGFSGFQHKMVSMLLYFFDFEGWLPEKLVYPSPADFHHYRLFLATGAITVVKENGTPIRFSEKISVEIRSMLLAYLRKREVKPLELSDALWLFSLLLCGQSPVTVTKEDGTNLLNHRSWRKGVRNRFFATCGRCPFETTCTFAIPAKPYYRRGIFELRKRPTMKEVYRLP